MEEMKSIYQVPVTGQIIDLHYLIHVSETKFMTRDFSPYPNKNVYSDMTIMLNYRFLEKDIEIRIVSHELFSQQEWNTLKDWKYQSIKRFEEKIRMPVIKAWEEYRKHMVE
jgi:hypothetical protein